jgi:hypothetical protein
MVGRMQCRRSRITAMLFQEFAGCLYILCQQLGYIPVHVRPNHDSETGNFLGIGWHRVCCQDPAALADFSRNIELVVPGHGLIHLSRLARNQSIALSLSVIKVACAIAELAKGSAAAKINFFFDTPRLS